MEDDLVVLLECSTVDAELVADRLWQAGATAVGFEEADDTTTLTASFPTNDAARTVSREIDGARLVSIDPTWRDEWKKYAEPFDVGAHLRVAPAWRDVELTDRTTIRIDPGYAFGSGSHASTRMILAELDRVPPTGLRVLDMGCGSGILSVAAAVLGAAEVDGIDIDPEAVRATEENAAANGVGDRVRVVDAPAGLYDLTLVNVTAAIHADIGPAAAAATRAGGTILIAGLLPGQWRHIEHVYAGTETTAEVDLDGWEGRRLKVEPRG